MARAATVRVSLQPRTGAIGHAEGDPANGGGGKDAAAGVEMGVIGIGAVGGKALVRTGVATATPAVARRTEPHQTDSASPSGADQADDAPDGGGRGPQPDGHPPAGRR